MAGVRKGVFGQRLRCVIDESLLRRVGPAVVGVEADGIGVRRFGEGGVIGRVRRHGREVDPGGLLRRRGPAGEGAGIALARPRGRLARIDSRGVLRIGPDRQHTGAGVVHPGHGMEGRGEAAERGVIDRVLRHGLQFADCLAAALARLCRPAGEGAAGDARGIAAVDRLRAVGRGVALEDVVAAAPGHGVAVELPDGVEFRNGVRFRAQVFDRLAVGVFYRAVFGQGPAEEVVPGVREGVLCQGLRRVINEGLIRHRPLAAPGVEADGVGVRGLGEGRVIGRVRRHAREVDAGGLVRRGGPALKGALVALPRPGRRRTGVDGLGVLRVGFDREDVSAVKAAPGHGVILRRKATEGGVVNDVLCHGLQLADSLAAALARRRRPACKGAAGGEGLRAGVDRLGAVLCGISLEHLIAAAPGHRVAVDLPDGVEVHDGVRFRAQVLHGLAVGVLHCAV